MQSGEITSAQATSGPHVTQRNSGSDTNIQRSEGSTTVGPNADVEQAKVYGPGKAPTAVARHSRHINAWSAVRTDPKDILTAEKLSGLDVRNQRMVDILTRMAERPHLADVVKLLTGHVDAAKEHDHSLHNDPGWKPLAALWAGRSIFTTLQLARPVVEMLRDGTSRKSVAMFIPHQALSLVFAIGLSMRGTTHWRVVKDQLAKRDTFLTFQAAFKIFGLYGPAKAVVDNKYYSGFVTAFSVLAAIQAIFPNDFRHGWNVVRHGTSEPRLSKARARLTDEDKADIRALRTEAQAASTNVREARDEFPDKPTESTDLVLGSFEGAYVHVDKYCSLLLGEPPKPQPNSDVGTKTAHDIITALITISPIPFLKGNEAAIMGVAANHTLGDYVQTRTTLDPSQTKVQTWGNFTKFCAVTAFMGILFFINDKVLNDPKEGNFMERSNGNALIFAGIFTTIALLTPGLVVNGLAAGAGAGWKYAGKPVANKTVVPAWKYAVKPAANYTVVPAWQHAVKPAWNYTGGAAINAIARRKTASALPTRAQPLNGEDWQSAALAGQSPTGVQPLTTLTHRDTVMQFQTTMAATQEGVRQGDAANGGDTAKT